MEIIAIFELSTIDLLGKPLLTSIVERFLGLWNVNQKPINTKHACRRSFIYLPILQMYFILAHIGKVGVSHTSVFVSPVQKLVWKITAQHWVGKKVDFHME